MTTSAATRAAKAAARGWTTRGVRAWRNRTRPALTRAALGLCAIALAAAAATPAAARSVTGDFLAAKHAEAVNDVHLAARYFRRVHERAQDDAQVANAALIYSVMAGELYAATPIAERVRKRAHENGVANMVSLTNLFRQKRFQEANERLAEGDNGVVPLMAALMRTWAAAGSGDRAAAEAELAKMNRGALHKIFAGYHGGLVALLDNDAEAALKAFRQAREANGGLTARLALLVGEALQRAGRRDEAVAFYDEAIGDVGPDATLKAAMARLERGDAVKQLVATPVEALAEGFYGLAAAVSGRREDGARDGLIYSQVALYLNPSLHEAHLIAGGAFAMLERHAAAVATYERVAEGAPSYVAAQSGRANSLARLGLTDQALEALSSIVDRAPSPARIYFSIADFYRRDERFSECADAFDQGFARLSADEQLTWPVHFYRGVCYERSGAWMEAERSFETALELEPDEPEVLNYLGYSLIEQRRRLEGRA